MFKALGIIMVLFACFMFSYVKADELKRKYNNLRQMKKALSVMKSEISFTSKELSKTTDELSALLPGDMSHFFKRISHYLSENEASDFEHAWKRAKNDLASKPFLCSAADRVMTDFSQRVGKMSRDIELENISKTLDALDVELAEERESYTANRKLIFTMGIGAGLVALILFI